MDAQGRKHRPEETRTAEKGRGESKLRSARSSGFLCAGSCAETRTLTVSFPFTPTKPGLSFPCLQRRKVNGEASCPGSHGRSGGAGI